MPGATFAIANNDNSSYYYYVAPDECLGDMLLLYGFLLLLLFFFLPMIFSPVFLEGITEGNELTLGMEVDGIEKGCTGTFGEKVTVSMET